MPSPQEIVANLTSIANQALPVAVGWHVSLLAVLADWLSGARPSKRVTGCLLAMPLVSVGVLAFIYGNPFNGAVFAGLAAILIVVGIRFEGRPVEVGKGWRFALGLVMTGFAWVYPHFLDDHSAFLYLVGAPMGVVPCPSLSLVIGVSLLLRGVEGRGWSLIVGAAGLFYGVIGAGVLGVRLDLVLVAGSAALLASVLAADSGLRASRRPSPAKMAN